MKYFKSIHLCETPWVCYSWITSDYFSLWSILDCVHCVKHLESVHIVNHSQSLYCEALSVDSVCETPLIDLFAKHLQLFCIVKHPQSFSPHKESLISEFNLQSTDLYLTYSVCTWLTQSALSSLSLHSVHLTCIQLTWLALSSLSLHSAFFLKAVRWLTLWSWLLYDKVSVFDCLSRNWKFSFSCSFCKWNLNQIRVSEYVKRAFKKDFLEWTLTNVCVSCSS